MTATLNQMVREIETALKPDRAALGRIARQRLANPFKAAGLSHGTSVAGEPQQFAATFFPADQDAHVKAFYIRQHPVARANEAFADAIKAAGSISAFLQSLRVA